MLFTDEAIRNLYPNVVSIEHKDKIEALDLNNNIVDIDEILVVEEEKRLETEYMKLEYSRLRKTEYPSWEDQLDDIFHNGVDGWKSNIQTIKDKYPKPE